ncbi:hypothetical protein EYF80_062158 [Liparis tanakae]|uniref:Uncharacterized protein n=1 Tax=Liparis tanakae TaxID=230148 RepID=A0A4Z2EFP4_9TELE|nr:hypothetical protein EYF80_062158 [Liparis tanakae]
MLLREPLTAAAPSPRSATIPPEAPRAACTPARAMASAPRRRPLLRCLSLLLLGLHCSQAGPALRAPHPRRL